MKLKIIQMIDAFNVLDSLSENVLNIKTSYMIIKNIRILKEEMDNYEIQRQKLIDKYCLKDKDNNRIVDENGNVQIKDIKKWEKDFTELLNLDIDLEIFKIDLDDLIDSECKISPIDLVKIEPFINN